MSTAKPKPWVLLLLIGGGALFLVGFCVIVGIFTLVTGGPTEKAGAPGKPIANTTTSIQAPAPVKQERPPPAAKPTPSGKWTGKTLDELTPIIERSIHLGAIQKLEPMNHAVWLDRSIWDTINIDEKTGLAMGLADYCDLMDIELRDTGFVVLYDFQSGKKLATMGASGLNVE